MCQKFDGSMSCVGCCRSRHRKAEGRAWDSRYNADAVHQMSQLQGNHPVRKVLHMQKCYPETVLRLNNRGSSSNNTAPVTSRWLRSPCPNNMNTSPAPQHHHHRVSTSRGSIGGRFEVSENTARRWKGDEYQFCRDKMAYNRTKGRYGCVPTQLPLLPIA